MSRAKRNAWTVTIFTAVVSAGGMPGCSSNSAPTEEQSSVPSSGGAAGAKTAPAQTSQPQGGAPGTNSGVVGGTTQQVGAGAGGVATQQSTSTSTASGGSSISSGVAGSGTTALGTGGTSKSVGGTNAGGTKSGTVGVGGTVVTTPTIGGSGGAGGAKSGVGGSAIGAGGTKATGGTSSSAAGTTSTGADVIANIKNGGFWNDVAGARIEAHGGGFLRVGDTWYWIGEDKSANSGGFKAVNCYSSPDLEHWKFENAIITKSTATELAASDRIIERPKVIFNDTTKQYVMWLHWEGQNYAEAKAGVFTSSTICGNYAYKSAFRPNNNMSRDDTLFKDDDGKAYFLSAANENADLVLYELSADYLTVAKQVAILWAGAKREAPALFKQEGRYFLITSGCTGWDPNQAQYASATSIGGPWTALTNIGNNTTYDTQSTYIIPVIGSKTTTYVYAGDRWQDPDLQSSKYIWLPLKLSGTKLTLDYYDRWQLNLTSGEWSSNDGFIPQSGWKLIRADSEETEGENGRATNAFDDSVSTIWHTTYTGTTPAYPHEIQIDLGATYAISGMRCLPRQDKDNNGIIAKYEFYASDSASNWGSPVASGTFDTTRNEHIVSFPKMNARYIRLVALSEIEGGAWASLAELDLVPAP